MALPPSELPLKAFLCHCTSCRHSTGTLCHSAARLPKQYPPSQTVVSKLKPFEFSKQMTLYFCPHCGTLMFVRHLEDGGEAKAPALWFATTGTLTQADGVFTVQSHVFIADTLDGGFSDFLPAIDEKPVPRWPRRVGDGKELPLFWQSSAGLQRPSSSSDTLHAHCKCGGVSFWIAKPSDRSTRCAAEWPDFVNPLPVTAHEQTGTWWLGDGGKKFVAGICACTSCRLSSGMEWAQWAFVPTIDITLDAEGKTPFSREFGTLKPYRSSDKATRYFCRSCGATVFWDGDERPQLIDVAVGLLDAPEGARAEIWLEWGIRHLIHREEAVLRAESVTLGVEAGIGGYVERCSSRANSTQQQQVT